MASTLTTALDTALGAATQLQRANAQLRKLSGVNFRQAVVVLMILYKLPPLVYKIYEISLLYPWVACFTYWFIAAALASPEIIAAATRGRELAAARRAASAKVKKPEVSPCAGLSMEDAADLPDLT